VFDLKRKHFFFFSFVKKAIKRDNYIHQSVLFLNIVTIRRKNNGFVKGNKNMQ